ncbi:serine/threonine protein kinase [Streptosporangium becharense]|uniref:Serine/threonine protein kinase n=1 Tax=Streptosporangium becharense TaxID=1816182 RepID=A0A7W9IB84_9ACTN|nr:protein kinase [Streptosporangium becharense]MBB2910793.1 serine/threonine protein kinase [Streptosporangium becharense]MBB5817488.1 serine/threonine protein kinase [Streptosporangium becharense]
MSHPLESGDPRWLGEYRLTGWLRLGSQGMVYDGYAEDGTRVAVKVLHRHRGCLTSAAAEEVAAARRVASPYVARILQARLDGPRPHVVSEFADGPDLFQVLGTGPRLLRAIGRRRRLAGGDLRRLAVGVAAALTGLHEAGVVHGDLKPSDIRLGPRGPRVTGFGVGRSARERVGDAVRITEEPVRAAPYVAPETIRGEEPTAATDVYAWGAIVLRAATGLPACSSRDLVRMLHRTLTEEHDLSGLPESLRPLVGAALAKDPSARPAASALLGALTTPAGAPGDEVSVRPAVDEAGDGPSPEPSPASPGLPVYAGR